ncbi:uncharacterized protein LOC132612093 [Lycium barbarum]|uniref:uncharacterized protein LOC132612093 n=1 Tax=Lycium barbarum TaxID=112863 RepID=UPI00293E2847|nr:uncharacterized protein LOC132612093 [Lycium barbarum]
MSDPPSLEKGEYINRPPRFNGQHYEWWKTRTQDFIIGHDSELWDIICDGSHSPTDVCVSSVATNPKIKDEQNDANREIVQKDIKAKNILISSLGSEEYNFNLLPIDSESIFDMYARFSSIIDELRSLGKGYEEESLNRKLLWALPISWEKKVCTIVESEDLANLTLDELIYNLKTYELETKDEENKKRRKKKRKVTKGENKNNPGNEESELTLITEELSKIGCCRRNAQEGKEKNQVLVDKLNSKPVGDIMVEEALAAWEDTSEKSEDENDVVEASSMILTGKLHDMIPFLHLWQNLKMRMIMRFVNEKNTLNKEADVLEQARDDIAVTIMNLREQVEELSRDKALLNSQMKKWINTPWRKQEGDGSKTHLEIESKLEKARMSLTDEVDKNRLLQKELKQVKTELKKSLLWTLPLDETTAMRNDGYLISLSDVNEKDTGSEGISLELRFASSLLRRTEQKVETMIQAEDSK